MALILLAAAALRIGQSPQSLAGTQFAWRVSLPGIGPEFALVARRKSCL